MGKLNLGLIFGGCSAEYAVSLQSAAAVLEHLDPAKYQPVLIGISRDGAWYRYQGPTAAIAEDIWLQDQYCTRAAISPSREVGGLLEWREGGLQVTKLDAVFPVLHGPNGEDGSVQGLLQLAGIPLVGCGLGSAAVCMDKDWAQRLVAAAGIATAPTVVLYRGEDWRQRQAELVRLAPPLFVKPARAGSSFGITLVEDPAALPAALELALQYDDKLLIQERVPGFEVGCAVLGNQQPIVGELDEIALQEGFFDYEEKYHLTSARIHLPARIPAATAQRIKEAARQVYRLLDCRGCARIDFFLTPGGEVVFNEVNTIPGFTAHSRYAAMLGQAGYSFAEVLDRLIALGVQA